MHSKLRRLFFGITLLVVFIGFTGCSARARLYPVQGPLYAQNPTLVFAGKLTVNANFKSGTFTAVLDGGEVFKGQLALVQTLAKKGSAAQTPPMAEGMDAAWDSIYGQGYYLAHVLGEGQYARAAITGSQGTLLQLEVHSSVSGSGAEVQTSQPKGVGKDSKGNVYKVVLG